MQIHLSLSSSDKKVCVALFIVDRLKQKTEFLILSYLAQQQTLINYSNISALTARRHAKTHLKHSMEWKTINFEMN